MAPHSSPVDVIVRVPTGTSVLVVADPEVADVRVELAGAGQAGMRPQQAWRSRDVDELLHRFATHGATRSYDHERVASELADLGFTAAAPVSRDGARPARAYLRWTVRGTEMALTIYQEGSGLVVDSQALIGFAQTLAGATVSGSHHARAKWHYREGGLEDALDAARALRGYADGHVDADATTSRPRTSEGR